MAEQNKAEKFVFYMYKMTGASLSYSWWNMEDSYEHDVTRYGGNIFVGKRLKWPDDYFYGQVGYGWLMNDQGPNIANSYVVYTGIESAFNFRIQRDDKNLPQFPTEGSRYVLDVQWANAAFGSDLYFFR